MDNRKRIIVRLVFVIVGILLVLTFFSNTIYNLDVAGVVVTNDTTDDVTIFHRGSSTLGYTETFYTHWAEHTGRIQFLVDDGDSVREEEPLFNIHVDVDRDMIFDRIIYLRHRNTALPSRYRAENNAEIRLLEELLDSEEYEIVYTHYAKMNGVVNLSSGMENRAPIIAGQPVLYLAVRQGHHFEFSIYLPSWFVPNPRGVVVREIEISVPAINRVGLGGDIVGITAVDDLFRLDFTVIAPDAIGGERVNVIIEDIYTTTVNHLPNYAIREDSRGNFILVARQEPNTMLGYSYIAERVDIDVTLRGDLLTVFNLDEELDAPIILQADRPVEIGDRIRLVGQR
ncbi:MAG: hypothetical protein FWD05_07440 [Oscillospiraceae bacterium]|nr:hypothetical protein [Oscillospiraceae bacterium]